MSFLSGLLKVLEVAVPLGEAEANIYVSSPSGKTQLSVQEPLVNDILMALSQDLAVQMAAKTPATSSTAASTVPAAQTVGVAPTPMLTATSTGITSAPQMMTAGMNETPTAPVTPAPTASTVESTTPAAPAATPHISGAQRLKEVLSFGIDRPKAK